MFPAPMTNMLGTADTKITRGNLQLTLHCYSQNDSALNEHPNYDPTPFFSVLLNVVGEVTIRIYII